MQVDAEDRLVEKQSRKGLPRLPLVLLVLLVVVAVVWYFSPSPVQDTAAPAPAVPSGEHVAKTPSAAAAAPDIPARPLPQVAKPPPEVATAQAPAEPPPPALTLPESDPLVRDALTATVTEAGFSQVLAADNLIERGTAVFDAAANGVVLREALPIPAIRGKFQVTEINGALVTHPDSYKRYDQYASAIQALDAATLASAFHTFRPLLETAYESLGYAKEDMDNALVAALDRVIAAPRLTEPATLLEATNRYVYKDPALENLSPLAGQLLRMGPENQAIVQDKARALRAALLATD